MAFRGTDRRPALLCGNMPPLCAECAPPIDPLAESCGRAAPAIRETLSMKKKKKPVDLKIDGLWDIWTEGCSY